MNRRIEQGAPESKMHSIEGADDLIVCLCTIGTRGDVLPFLYLANELVKKNISVAVLTNSNWRSLFAHLDLNFIGIANQDPAQTGRDDVFFFKENISPSFSKTFAAIGNLIEKSREICVVYRSGMAGAIAAIEAYNLKSMKIMLQPSQVKSCDRPSWPLTSLSNSSLSFFNKKVTLPLIYTVGKLRSVYRREINLFRQEHGLQKLPVLSKPDLPSYGTVMFCPDWFAMPQSDWPEDIRCVGFPYKDLNDVLDPNLIQFLECNKKPIVFTFGTGVDSIKKLIPMVEEICLSLSLPGVILSNDTEEYQFKELNIYKCSFAPLDELLPHSALLVHHGGIGTTAQAIRAGIPQVIFPDRFDQPDNAIRIAELGLGGTIFEKNIKNEDLVNLLNYLSYSSEIEKNLKEMRQNVNSQDTIKDTVALLMYHLSSPDQQ